MRHHRNQPTRANMDTIIRDTPRPNKIATSPFGRSIESNSHLAKGFGKGGNVSGFGSQKYLCQKRIRETDIAKIHNPIRMTRGAFFM